MEYAPIGLSTYTRINHLEKTVEALRRNRFAEQSLLYIFSDAAKPGDEEKVGRVRSYLRSIDGFKKVTIIEREENNRVHNNRQGMESLLNRYGKMIFVEEDIVTSNNFLEFINSALNYYENDNRIIAISGYTPPIKIPINYKYDIYLSPRFSAWGFGIWKDRFERIIWDICYSNYEKIEKNPYDRRSLCRGGPDILGLVKKTAEGRLDALDVKIMYTQYRYNLFTIAPTYSLTSNIGHDGTGEHSTTTNRFKVKLNNYNKNIKLEEDLQPNKKIERRLYVFRARGYLRIVSRFIEKIVRKRI